MFEHLVGHQVTNGISARKTSRRGRLAILLETSIRRRRQRLLSIGICLQLQLYPSRLFIAEHNYKFL